ncbi:hypothetical protein [Paenarthrobacter sp. PH39-S1]|uniref:hypothetical protein n=1 Tax=Paenarthrobacter sp. PH39-S1 TaxID=3046204 RepID=UPI0024BA8621|nr:hypothetical protein [Paenarthrobacter sp. PH39-S1]MDJ0357884.1 hypothetical protein [Paenarthrobacter sp. PH39-S1]
MVTIREEPDCGNATRKKILRDFGRGASVDGFFDVADGTRRGFGHVLRFAGAAKTAKIVGVKSHVINITDESTAALTAQL